MASWALGDPCQVWLCCGCAHIRYFAAADIEDCWCVYPWDAEDIYAHTQRAEAAAAPLPQAELSKRQSSGVPCGLPAAVGTRQGLSDVTNGHAAANGNTQQHAAFASNGCA